MNEHNESESTNAIVTAKAPMNILRKDDSESLMEALEREINEELTPERAMEFLKDASLETEPIGDGDN